MNFLPIVQRELLVASRSAAIRWQRFTAVALGVLVFLVVLSSHRTSPSALGPPLFSLLTFVLWILAWLSGPLFTTDSLTREKREGTLGILLLTDLAGYDIVLGKLAASSVHQVMLLVGVLPVLALPLALGGTAAGESWRVMLSLVLTQGFSLSLGLFFSAVSPTFWQALRRTIAWLGLITLLPPALLLGFRAFGKTGPDILLGLGPRGQTLCGMAEYQRLNPGAAAQWSVGALILLGLTVLAIAAAAVAVVSRPEQVGVGFDAGTIVGCHPLTGWRHIHWRDWLEQNPYYWLERACRLEKRPLAGASWMAICISAGAAASMFFAGGAAPGARLVAILAAYVATQCVKFGYVLAGTRRLGEDLRSGGLELLLTSPLTSTEIVDGCRLALAKEFRPLLIGLHLLYAVLFAAASLANVAGLNGLWILFAGASIMLPFDFRWGTIIALRAAVRETDPLRALRRAVARVFIPGWVALMVTVVYAIAGVGGIAAVVGGLLFVGAVVAVRFFARRAWIDLEFGLRDIAAGVGYDTDQRELAEDFKRAAMTWEDRWFNRR